MRYLMTVSYDGKSTTLTVEIIAKQITSIAISQKPTKLNYIKERNY